MIRSLFVGSLAMATALVFSGEEASAQCGYGGRYYGGSGFSIGYSSFAPRSSFSFGYNSGPRYSYVGSRRAVRSRGHYHWNPTQVYRHRNHYHVEPGGWDYHRHRVPRRFRRW